MKWNWWFRNHSYFFLQQMGPSLRVNVKIFWSREKREIIFSILCALKSLCVLNSSSKLLFAHYGSSTHVILLISWFIRSKIWIWDLSFFSVILRYVKGNLRRKFRKVKVCGGERTWLCNSVTLVHLEKN